MYLLLNNIRNESIILESIFLIQKRFEVINSIEDFDTELGKEKR